MAGEVKEIEAVDDAQADADFGSGFDMDETTTTPSSDKTDPVAEVVTEVTAPAPKFAQITEDQFNDLLAKAATVDEIKAESTRKFDNAFGQLGGLKQAIERFQSNTPSGQSVQVTDEDFSELKAEFPELADMQIKGLNKVLSKLRGGGQAAVDPALIERMNTVAAENRADALDGLNNVIPEWEAEVKKPAFSEWLSKQDQTVQALAQSDKVRDASRMLRLYRDDKPAPVVTPPAKPTVSTRQRQLEAAVTPPSARGQAPDTSEVDDFEAGFNSR